MNGKIEVYFLYAEGAPFSDAVKQYLNEMISCHELMMDWQAIWKELELAMIRNPQVHWAGKIVELLFSVKGPKFDHFSGF